MSRQDTRETLERRLALDAADASAAQALVELLLRHDDLAEASAVVRRTLAAESTAIPAATASR